MVSLKLHLEEVVTILTILWIKEHNTALFSEEDTYIFLTHV